MKLTEDSKYCVNVKLNAVVAFTDELTFSSYCAVPDHGDAKSCNRLTAGLCPKRSVLGPYTVKFRE